MDVKEILAKEQFFIPVHQINLTRKQYLFQERVLSKIQIHIDAGINPARTKISFQKYELSVEIITKILQASGRQPKPLYFSK